MLTAVSLCLLMGAPVLVLANYRLSVKFCVQACQKGQLKEKEGLGEFSDTTSPILKALRLATFFGIAGSLQNLICVCIEEKKGYPPRTALNLVNDWRAILQKKQFYYAQPPESAAAEKYTIYARDALMLSELVFGLAGLWVFPACSLWCAFVLYLLFVKLCFLFRSAIIHVASTGVWNAPRSVSIAMANYCFLIVAFANIYMFVGSFPNQFNKCPNESALACLYFSTITIATVGYGDFVPTGNLARCAAATEAIVGVFTLAIVIQAFLTTLRRPTETSEPVRDKESPP